MQGLIIPRFLSWKINHDGSVIGNTVMRRKFMCLIEDDGIFRNIMFSERSIKSKENL